MTDTPHASPEIVEEALEIESGRRHPTGVIGWLVVGLLIGWSLFQLAIAGMVTLDAHRVRIVHLGFAMALSFLLFPARKGSSATKIPMSDWLWFGAALLGPAYLIFDYDGISHRPGAPLTRDIVVGGVAVVALLEAARRTLGPALSILASLFLAYTFFGRHMPEIIIHRGYSIGRVVDHQFLTTEGIFGVPLGVSASYVFLFVLFGALLEKGGAGAYFIDLSYSLLGRFRGGPAKAAILSSGLTGMVNGSSTANVVTTGSFTIPLMKQVGYPAEKAAAVEVAASTNGQLMPPIMGAAAFIIAEFLGIGYLDVVKAAMIPAFCAYLTLFYIVHLEALKLGMKGAPKELIPRFLSTFVQGIHYLIPVVFLIGGLLWMQLSPVSAVYQAIGGLVVIMMVQHPLRAARAKTPMGPAFWQGAVDVFEGIVMGARNMIPIGVATAAAGIVVGTVTLTGQGMNAVDIVEAFSMGSLALALIITALTCMILGMGLPTTANYIVMATLVAPVIVSLGASNGLVVPLIAAHLFVFFFGILADVTPPVALAAYAAAGIAGSDPIKTGVQALIYDLRTAILPFMFIFNTEILLVGVDSVGRGIMVFLLTLAGMFAFAAATQGFMMRRLDLWERAALLAGALLVVNPHLFDHLTGGSVGYGYAFIGVAICGGVVGRQYQVTRTEGV